MAKTINYDWDLPSPRGLQLGEIAKIATTFTAIDVKIKSFETTLTTHKHAFADLTNKPTTLGGFGITDGMTADEVAQAIKSAVDNLVNGSGEALDTLKELADALGNDPNFATSVSTALGVRVRVDAATNFSLAQRAQGRSNIDALGTVDRGAAGGVASLDSGGKVPSAQLPALTTTATVGAAVAGANGKATPADGDFFAGVEAGGSTMFKTTWANIKAALQSFYDARFVMRDTPTFTSSVLDMLSTGFCYICWRSAHVAFVKKRGEYRFYWRANDTGASNGPNSSDLMTLEDNGTLAVQGLLRIGGGDSARYQEDGNVYGTTYGGYLKNYINNTATQAANNAAATKTAPQNCSWSSGIMEFGSIDVGYGNVTIDLPSPYVMVGIRSASGTNRVFARGIILKNNGG